MALKRFHKLLTTLCLATLLAWPAFARAESVSEYQIKAAFIYNFAKFVEWPACDTCPPDAPFIVGILGDDPFGQDMAVLEGKNVKGRPLHIIRAATLDELKGSDVLFITSSVRTDLGAILSQVKDRPILTVGDTGGFAQAGVMINLYTADKKIRFEINPQAAEAVGLKISSHLLRLAKIVKP